jgi:ATP-dependent Clp protease protease subunit
MSANAVGSFPPTPPPWRPGHPWPPEYPGPPGRPWPPPQPPMPAPGPARVWIDRSEWPGRLYDRLLEQRIVMVTGVLDDEAATGLSAQLLTLDADGTQPIRLELQSLDAQLAAALSVMGVLDVIRAPISAYAGGRICGPALGVLSGASHRYAYPSALFVLCEPPIQLVGTVRTMATQKEQVRLMLDELFFRLAEVTGRDADQIRSDFEQQRLLGLDEAIDYSLVHARAGPRKPAHPGLQPGTDQ